MKITTPRWLPLALLLGAGAAAALDFAAAPVLLAEAGTSASWPSVAALPPQFEPIPALTGIEIEDGVYARVRLGCASALSLPYGFSGATRVVSEVDERGVLRLAALGATAVPQGAPVEVCTEQLERLSVLGSGRVELSGLDGGVLALSVSGAATVRIAGRLDAIAVTLDGAGLVDVEAPTRAARVTINGSGRVRLDDSRVLAAVINGSGRVVWDRAPEELSAQVQGEGGVSGPG